MHTWPGARTAAYPMPCPFAGSTGRAPGRWCDPPIGTVAAVIVIGATLDYPDQATRDAAVAASAPIQHATRVEEAGCQSYCFAPDPCVPTRIQVHEVWDDEASLAAHFVHPNYLAMRDLLRSFAPTGAWNRMYLVARDEPVYGPEGAVRSRFFVDE